MTSKAQKLIEQKQCVIFDFDGTIASLNINWQNWYKGASIILKEFEPSFEGEGLGNSLHKLENNFFKKYGKGCRDKIDKHNADYEEKNCSGCTPNEKVIALIRSLHDKKLYVWSSNSTPTVLKYLKALGIQNLFEKIITRSEVMFLKPSGDGFAKIFDPKYKKQDYLMIGDSLLDAAAAKDSGIDFLYVSEL